MRNTHVLVLLLTLSALISHLNGQEVWQLKDPSGNMIELEKDSFEVLSTDNHLAIYLKDNNGLKNVLISDLKEGGSKWLFPLGFELNSSFFGFQKSSIFEEYYFGIGQEWFESDGTVANTKRIYDGDTSNYIINYIFPYEDMDFAFATNKTTLNQVLLIDEGQSFSPALWNGREVMVEHHFDFEEYDFVFVGRTFSGSDSSYSQKQVLRIKPFNAERDIMLDSIEESYANYQWLWVSPSFKYLTFTNDNGVLAYDYDFQKDTLLIENGLALDNQMHFNTIFNNVNLYGINQPWSIMYEVSETSEDSTEYYLKVGPLQTNIHLEALRGVYPLNPLVDNSKSLIFYYDYSSSSSAFCSYNIPNTELIRAESEIEITTDYELGAYFRSIYYAKFDPEESQLFAMKSDYQNNVLNKYIEATNGDRISNPIKFNFLEDRILVQSMADQSIKLMVYDKSRKPSSLNKSELKALNIYPNPSINQIFVEDLSVESSILKVYNASGILVKRENINAHNFRHQMDIGGLVSGTYTIISSDTKGTTLSSNMFIKQ